MSKRSDWEKLSSEFVYDGYRKVERQVVKMPDGDQADFDIIVGADIAAVFAMTTDQRVIVCKNWRVGPATYLWDPPGGMIDAGETPKVAAARELLEETGYKVKLGNLSHIGSQYRGGFESMKKYIYLAKDCQLVTEPKLDKEEFTTTELFTILELRKIISKPFVTSDLDVFLLGLAHLNLAS